LTSANRLAVSRRVLFLTGAIVLALAGLAIARSGRANIHLGKTRFGPYVAPRLQNGHHYPIYMSTHDQRDKSRCSGSCTLTYQPVITYGGVKAWDGVKQKLLGTINRSHGVKQVTYNHHPLYTSSSDTPGTAGEDGCWASGGEWFVLDKNGNPDERWVCQFYP
jgi:predicted lipoprotein with Yx(FWY)xxD motif